MAVSEYTGPKSAPEPTTSNGRAEVSVAPARARMPSGRNSVGGHDGTSQCQRNNGDRDSMQCGFSHDGYLHIRNDSMMSRYAVCGSGIDRCRKIDVYTASEKRLINLVIA